jgi:hypothetical protein
MVVYNNPADYDCEANYPPVFLADYERIAQATGKPIDLFLSPCPGGFSFAGWYNPKEQGRGWIFEYRFTSKWWFESLKPMTADELIALALGPGIIPTAAERWPVPRSLQPESVQP